jgi:ribosomal-protein-alanine N-acetyltransferase
MSAVHGFKSLGLADLPKMMEIERSSFDNSWSAQVMRDSLNAAHTQCFGIVVDFQLIGYVVFSIVLDEAEILSMTIHPSQQGKGYGKALLNYAIDAAKHAGAEVIYLEVRANHPIAIPLYEKMGFVRIGMRPDYYPNVHTGKRDDALLMSLSVSSNQ